MNARRHPRSLLEAWPAHYSQSITHYRRPLAERVGRLIGHLAVLALFAALGVLLAWRG